jgi:hypothetical protein
MLPLLIVSFDIEFPMLLCCIPLGDIVLLDMVELPMLPCDMLLGDIVLLDMAELPMLPCDMLLGDIVLLDMELCAKAGAAETAANRATAAKVGTCLSMDETPSDGEDVRHGYVCSCIRLTRHFGYNESPQILRNLRSSYEAPQNHRSNRKTIGACDCRTHH